MAFLILADGTVFEGKSMGAQGRVIGETVFTTGMTGYLETLTDPSYYGQIVTQTFPLIGNYGVIPEDFESKKSHIKGYIVRELCDRPSNFRCNGTLDEFLKKQNITGLYGIDTRALTKILRETGVMNGMIVSDDVCPVVDEKLLDEIKSFSIRNAVSSVQAAMIDEPLKNGVFPEKSFYKKRAENKNRKKELLLQFLFPVAQSLGIRLQSVDVRPGQGSRRRRLRRQQGGQQQQCYKDTG